jgi:hypothetical protein
VEGGRRKEEGGRRGMRTASIFSPNNSVDPPSILASTFLSKALSVLEAEFFSRSLCTWSKIIWEFQKLRRRKKTSRPGNKFNNFRKIFASAP